MALALRPTAVHAIDQLETVEQERYQTILEETTSRIQSDGQIKNGQRQHILEANAIAIEKFALSRGFYSETSAQSVEIDVQLNPRVIIQQPETLSTVVKKGIVTAVFTTLGWHLSNIHPGLGVACFAVSQIAISPACKEQCASMCGR